MDLSDTLDDGDVLLPVNTLSAIDGPSCWPMDTVKAGKTIPEARGAR